MTSEKHLMCKSTIIMGSNRSYLNLTGAENELNMVDSSNTSENNCGSNKIITQQVVPLIYGFIFIGGILLNAAAAWIFLHIPSKTSFIVYLKNIVTADLIMSLTYPFKILSDSKIGHWQLNVVVCRYSAVIFYLNMYISITLFGLIGFDRCFKIMKPQFSTSAYNVQCSKIVCLVIWLLQILISFPNIILTNQTPTEDNSNDCMKLKSHLGIQWHTASSYTCLGIFWIVFFLLIVFYSSIAKKIYISHQKFKKNSKLVKKKTNRNIFTIMFVFIVCFVPYHLVRAPYTLNQIKGDYHCEIKNMLFYLKELTLLLSAANVCLDPVIYVFLCQPFKEKLYQKLHLKVRTSEEFENSKSRKSNAIETVTIL
ncbi:P2Y purinoceptor 14 isoform X4 [Protobothrops mucrosquamatus]|uniref:P2Y purinoceptor 14 isoform X4 n=1 Tax=Protobothrops mucrosquamatus TaxID=103944 RepID=UPI000775A94E|nr:P2Y purinoceptor 14 isoform X4 [Protobothrops mucrosquamatus]XP_015669799.1 P2Y purinoceptor 14 isoform X4 [Protobothrops mucrosquamatus]